MLLVHGGAWVAGSRRDDAVRAEAKRLAAQGYVAFSVGYRLVNAAERMATPDAAPRNRWPACVDDCQRAVRWVRAHAAQWRLDPERLGAIGWSAGGHLVGLLGTMETRDNSDAALAGQSSKVAAVVDVFGPTDFMLPLPTNNLLGLPVDPSSKNWAVSKPVQFYVDDLLGSTDEAARKAASPRHHVDAKDAPFLVIHGGKDKLVPLRQSEVFRDALKAAGVPAELLVFPEEGHGFARPSNQKRCADAVDAFFAKWLRAAAN